ncbi:hypothetical protein BGZ63DRAFT_230818 [Mariannaea sp. PMI_226]|nr:hypothetical protein BGZ63DRAFT_230818 [Mariannaea sp. PMI_226]
MSDLPQVPHKTRACESCARAKAKCVWSNRQKQGVTICERCFRGDFLCIVPQPGPRKRRGKSTRVKIIEQKLDGIMSMLGEKHHLLQSSPSSQPTPSPELNQTPPSRTFVSSTCIPISQALSDVPRPNQPVPPRLYSAVEEQQLREQVVEIAPGYKMSFEEAEHVLHEYMTTMLPQFPFVPLASTNVYEMSREQPVLLKVILHACRPPSQSIRAEFEQWFRHQIAHQIVVLGARRLELLQAILIFLAWNDFRYYADSRQTSLLQLAAGLVSDAGLNTCPEGPGPIPKNFVEDAKVLRMEIKPREHHTNPERRTVLGLFYIASSVSLLLSKSPCLGYSSYFERCCDILIRDQQYPTDILLVQLVRVQHIAAKVTKMFMESSEAMDRGPQRGFYAMAMPIMRTELDQWMAQLPMELKSSTILCSHYQAILIRLFEPAIHIPASEWPGSALTRAQRVWDCFQNARTLGESLLQCPVADLSRATFALTAHLALAVIKIIRLLCWEDPDWDAVTASKIAKIDELLQKLSDHFEAASRVRGPRRIVIHENQDLLTRYAERLRSLMEWCSLHLVQPPAPADLNTTVPDVLVSNALDQLGDFEFWQSMANSGYGYLSTL